MVKQQVTIVKDLGAVLSDMEAWVKNPSFLHSGRKGNMQLLPREILANWLLCAVYNFSLDKQSITFSNDPFGDGDGIIVDRESNEQVVTEHVFIPKIHVKDNSLTAEELIVKAINKKQNKGGKAYAEGKHLIVFCEGLEEWVPNKAGREIAGKHDFVTVWAIGLVSANDDIYKYSVAYLHNANSPVFLVEIDFSENSWEVSRIQ